LSFGLRWPVLSVKLYTAIGITGPSGPRIVFISFNLGLVMISGSSLGTTLLGGSFIPSVQPASSVASSNIDAMFLKT